MNKEVVEQQDNVVTTKDKYNRVIKRSIILCWIALAICFIVKIFGGNFLRLLFIMTGSRRCANSAKKVLYNNEKEL